MAKQIFVNFPVKDLRRSIHFFESLGFAFDPKFTDERAGCLIVGENIYAMLLGEEFSRPSQEGDLRCDEEHGGARGHYVRQPVTGA